jgi:hypothetical protein
MKGISQLIRKVIQEALPLFNSMKIEQVTRKANPDKWSKIEILGHLIDSALNNHQRFVRASMNAAAAFPPYSQNDWVRIQHYHEADWGELITLWSALNLHLSYIIERIPHAAYSSPCNIGKAEPVTLEFVVKDYLRHLRHHVDQILDRNS